MVASSDLCQWKTARRTLAALMMLNASRAGLMRAVKDQRQVEFVCEVGEAREDFAPAVEDIVAARHLAIPGQPDLADRTNAIAICSRHRERRREVIIGKLEALRMKSDRRMHEVRMGARQLHHPPIRGGRDSRRDDGLHAPPHAPA